MTETALDLSQKHCKACEGGAEPLDKKRIAELLKDLPEWAVKGGELVREFAFKNYYETMAFVNATAWISHRENHHPDLEVGYNKCVVRYSTHAVGGLSENDFICAAKVSALEKGQAAEGDIVGAVQGGLKRVLIVSASAGNGHTRAGEALLAAFKNHPGVAQVEHWDLLQYTTPLFRWIYSRGYSLIVSKTPRAFGFLYTLTDTPWKNEAGRLAFEKTNSGRFFAALGTYQPDLIVSTHFTPPFLVSSLIEKGRCTARSAIVITDLDVHATWLARHYERYFCMLEEAKAYLESVGVDPARVTVSGIPLDSAFGVAKEKVTLRRALGLDPDRFTVLFSAGGCGATLVEEILNRLFTLKIPAQVIAVAGRSPELKSRIDSMAAHAPGTIRVLPVGFTRQMDEYMAAADVLISKPGGLTACEAMARGLPMCIINPIPGQEEHNADHLLEAGAAIRCHNIPTLAYKLEQLVKAGELEVMSAKARALGKPQAAQIIVDTLLNPATPQPPASPS